VESVVESVEWRVVMKMRMRTRIYMTMVMVMTVTVMIMMAVVPNGFGPFSSMPDVDTCDLQGDQTQKIGVLESLLYLT
jgi:hypothetical protein